MMSKVSFNIGIKFNVLACLLFPCITELERARHRRSSSFVKNNEIGCKQILNGLAVRHLTVVLSVVVVVSLAATSLSTSSAGTQETLMGDSRSRFSEAHINCKKQTKQRGNGKGGKHF